MGLKNNFTQAMRELTGVGEKDPADIKTSKVSAKAYSKGQGRRKPPSLKRSNAKP